MNRRKKLLHFARMLILAGLSACDACPSANNTEPVEPTLVMSASPKDQRVAQGASTLFTVTVGRKNFAGPVTLSAPPGGLPLGVTVDFDPQTLPEGVLQSTMRVSVSATAPVQYVAEPPLLPVPIYAKGPNDLAATATPNVQIVPSSLAGITLNATPSALTVSVGQNGESLVTIARQGNYSAPVTLALTTSFVGMNASLTPVNGVPDTWRLQFVVTDADALRKAAASATAGLELAYVLRASGQGLPDITTNLKVLVVFGSFLPTPERDARVVAGAQDVVRVTLGRSAGLTAAIAMAMDEAPAGITGTFAPNPATGDATSLTVRAAASVAPGEYEIKFKSTPPTGMGLVEMLTRMKVVVVAPPPIQPSCVLAAPASLSVVAGNTTSGTLGVTRASDFSGVVNVSVGAASGSAIPTGMSFAFDPPLELRASTTLRVTTTAATPAGTYSLVVSGSSANGACTSSPLSVVVTPVVTPPPPPPPTSAVTRIVIEPTNAEITAPATQQYSARLYNASGAVIAVETGGSIEYSASNGTPSNNVATINPTTGLATGVSAGTITITARYVRNGVQVVQVSTPLLVYAAGSSGHYGSATMSTNGNVRTIAREDSVLFQIIVRNTAGTAVTSGVNPAPTVSSSNPGAISVRSTTGPVPGYFFWMKAAPGATLNTEVGIRYDVNGAGGELLIRVVP